MVASASLDGCLTEDDLLELAGGSLADAPRAETHLAACATCSALLAAVVRTARPWDALAGTMLGPYRIDAQIGAGGMGAVYRAWDPRLGRALAVKVLHDQSEAVEARAAAAIDHRAVVAIHDVGVADGIHYVAMELVDGESVRSVLARGALGVARARELTAVLVDGLVAAHARGVVHRDLKPENLIVTRDGLRILDFGLAQVAGAAEIGAGGTAGYMAPEQARGLVADARADLFAAGAIAYELATGRRAFPGATSAQRLAATLRDTPPLDELGELAPIIARCLAKEPAERFQSASDLAWALRTAPPSTAARRRPSRRAFVLGGAAALATGVAGFALGRRRSATPVAAEPALRWLTHRTGRVYTARFTRDGRRVVYGAQWGTEPLRVHMIDLDAGQTTLLELPSADLLAVSARGELAVSIGHRFVDHQSQRGALGIMSLTDGVLRPIADDVQEVDFAPDGWLAGARPVTGEASKVPGGGLAVVRATGHTFRVELPLGTTLAEWPGWITHARVSPDGTQVAFTRHPHTDDDSGDLVIVDVATKQLRVLSRDWISLAGLAWDPDGRSIWFTASREGINNTIRRVTLGGDETAVSGPAAPRLRLHDIAADRRLLVTMDAWRARAMAGDRDVSMSEISCPSDLSVDGEQVVVGELGGLEAGMGAYLVPYTGGRRLRVGPGFPLAISPSGKRIAANVNEAKRLIVYSTGSGDAPAIATPGFVIFARWIDEQSLVALFEQQLWRLAIGRDPVKLAGTGGPLALDPTRRRCAYVDATGALSVLELASGAARKLLDGLQRTEVCGWLADPDAIAVRSTTTPIIVDRIDPVSGARTRHLEVQPPRVGLKAIDSFMLSADGKRYAYVYGEELSQLIIRG